MRVLVRSANARQAQSAQDALAAAGAPALAAIGPLGAGFAGTDLLIVDRRAEAGALPLARDLRGLSVGALSKAWGLEFGDDPGAARSGAEAGWPALMLDGPAAALRRQIDAALDTGLLREEARRRAAVAAVPDTAQSPLKRALSLRTLFVGAPHRCFLALEHEIKSRRGEVAAAFTPAPALDRLHGEAFDAVIVNAEEELGAAAAFCAALKRNRAFAYTPVMAVLSSGDAALAAAFAKKGAWITTRAGEASGYGLAWLEEAIRAAQARRHSERALVRATLPSRVGEGALLGAQAFAALADRSASDHHESGRPLCAIALRFSVQTNASVMREAAALLGGLLRRVDALRAHEAGNGFEALTPFVEEPTAQRMAKRISTVIETSCFAPKSGVAINLQTRVCELKPGESGAALRARAWRAFETEGCAA